MSDQFGVVAVTRPASPGPPRMSAAAPPPRTVSEFALAYKAHGETLPCPAVALFPVSCAPPCLFSTSGAPPRVTDALSRGLASASNGAGPPRRALPALSALTLSAAASASALGGSSEGG